MERTTAPKIKNATQFDIQLPDYDYFELKNNIPVYYVPSKELETIEIQWVFEAGSWYESKDLIASSTNSLLKRGTENKNSLEINETIEYYGAFLHLNCGFKTASLTLYCLVENLAPLLSIIRELLTEATFPEEEFALYLKNKKQNLTVKLKKNDFVADQLIDSYLFGAAHPYGRYSSKEKYDALKREDLLHFFKDNYQFNQCRIFAAGKVPSNFEAKLNEFFGDQQSGQTYISPNDSVIQSSPERKFRVRNFEQSVQGSVRLARLFPNRYHPDVPKMQVLNTVFGGYFGSRLMANIREDKGYTYGIYSRLSLYADGGSLTIKTEAGKDVCEAVVEESFKEMERLKSQLISSEELSLVKNYLIGGLLGGLDGCFKVMHYWRGLLLYGLDRSYFDQLIEAIKSAEPKELQQLAQKYFEKDVFYDLIVN